MRDFAQREEHVESDSCFVVLMSHGDASGICGVFDSFEDDDDVFQADEIFNCLNTPNCARLRDKPKIILIQACRGGELQNNILENKKRLLNSTLLNVVIFDWSKPHPFQATFFGKCCPHVIDKEGSVDVQDAVPRRKRAKEHREKDFCCLRSCTPGRYFLTLFSSIYDNIT